MKGYLLKRDCTILGHDRRAGSLLSSEEVDGIPAYNRSILIGNGPNAYLEPVFEAEDLPGIDRDALRALIREELEAAASVDREELRTLVREELEAVARDLVPALVANEAAGKSVASGASVVEGEDIIEKTAPTKRRSKR